MSVEGVVAPMDSGIPTPQGRRTDKSRSPRGIGATAEDYLPDVLSGDSFYCESYVLRRQVSTQQTSAINFLKSSGQEKVWSTLPVPSTKRLNMLTIGCGDGDLDFALLDSFGIDTANGVNVLALEPNGKMTETFLKRLPEQEWYGRQPSQGDVSVYMESKVFDPSTKHLAQNGELHDVALLGHVMYYFKDKAETLRSVLQHVRPGGAVVIIHQGCKGVPEIQEKLLPGLRGKAALSDMFTASDIEDILKNDVADEVSSFKNYQIDAYMNTKEVVNGTDDGLKIMSFGIEVDLRAANPDQLASVLNEFKQKSVYGPVDGHAGEGPFMYEPVHCFVIQRK